MVHFMASSLSCLITLAFLEPMESEMPPFYLIDDEW